MKTIYASLGDHISSTIKHGLEIARIHPLRVIHFRFNGHDVKMAAGELEDDVYARFTDDCERARQAYLKSPEGIASQKRADEHRKQADAARKEGIHRFKRKDDAAWQKWKTSNLDGGYGEAILRYASFWASLMDQHEGEPIESFAKDLSFQADREGITRFMYGAAVKVLSTCWVRGDELKSWHEENR